MANCVGSLPHAYFQFTTVLLSKLAVFSAITLLNERVLLLLRLAFNLASGTANQSLCSHYVKRHENCLNYYSSVVNDEKTGREKRRLTLTLRSTGLYLCLNALNVFLELGAMKSRTSPHVWTAKRSAIEHARSLALGRRAS